MSNKAVRLSGDITHTPGPWKLEYNEWGEAIISGGNDEFVLKITPDINPHQKHNARLIVSAPDLLEALENLVQSKIDSTTFTRIALDAIKKARGE